MRELLHRGHHTILLLPWDLRFKLMARGEARKEILANHTKARQTILFGGLFINNPGGFLLSHTVARAVPSAPRGLTSVFGMGTGVTLSTQPPENFSKERSLVLVLWSL